MWKLLLLIPVFPSKPEIPFYREKPHKRHPSGALNSGRIRGMRNGMGKNGRVVCAKRNSQHEIDPQQPLIAWVLKMLAARQGIHSFPNKKVKKKTSLSNKSATKDHAKYLHQMVCRGLLEANGRVMPFGFNDSTGDSSSIMLSLETTIPYKFPKKKPSKHAYLVHTSSCTKHFHMPHNILTAIPSCYI